MDIWPRPQQIEVGEDIVWFAAEASCQYRRKGNDEADVSSQLAGLQVKPNSDTHNRKDEEDSARIVNDVFERTKAMILKLAIASNKPREQNDPIEPPDIAKNAVFVRNIVIEEVVDSTMSSEWYCVRLKSDGECLIQIGSLLGVNRALATFVQLFQDAPKFEHRGLNLDISRNIIYPADVQRVLEGMWLNKMNKLHLHATDSQSWPIEIPSMPDLARKGAYDTSQIWTPDDVHNVQQFGEQRGIEVYFEIDLPGHTASIHHAFPELIVAYKQEPWHEYALEPPAGQLKLNSDAVQDFIARLFDDLLPRVAKHSRFFHLGGDELNKKVYTLEEGLESDSREILRPLLQRFFDHCVSKLNSHSLSPILWEEVLLEWDIQFPESTIFQSWKSQESLSGIVKRGHRALFGPCQYWYLDCGMGTWLDPDPKNPDTPIKYPFLDWCSPYKSWRTVYAYNPFEGIAEAHRNLIQGGEVHLWTEMVDSVSLDFMLWPRVAAAAEVLWCGPSALNEAVTRRLAKMRERLVSLGIQSGMVQMEWSLRNPGSSSL